MITVDAQVSHSCHCMYDPYLIVCPREGCAVLCAMFQTFYASQFRMYSSITSISTQTEKKLHGIALGAAISMDLRILPRILNCADVKRGEIGTQGAITVLYTGF